MNEPIPFSTDLATLVVFDPEELRHRVRESSTWWRGEPIHELDEVVDARIALFPLGKEGSYRVDLRRGELSEAELELAVGSQTGQGIKVSSGQVFVGAAERLPGEGRGSIISAIPGTGAVLEVEPGEYALEVWVLHWRDDDAYYDEDGEVVSGAPADFVILLGDRPAAFPPLEELTPLRELLPKAEAKGKAKVTVQPRRRRASATPSSGRRRRRKASPSVSRESAQPVPPRHVPEQVAPYGASEVRAAFREVLYGSLLHPPEVLDLRRIDLAPRERHLLKSDVALDLLHKKLTRVREQLRVLEGKVNGSSSLAYFDKLDLQSAVTGVYEGLDGLLDYLAAEASGFQARAAPPPPPSS